MVSRIGSVARPFRSETLEAIRGVAAQQAQTARPSMAAARAASAPAAGTAMNATEMANAGGQHLLMSVLPLLKSLLEMFSQLGGAGVSAGSEANASMAPARTPDTDAVAASRPEATTEKASKESTKKSSGEPAKLQTESAALGDASTPLMEKLAEKAKTVGNQGTFGACLKGVQDAMDAAGLSVKRRDSAYQLSEELEKDNRFKEIKVSPDELSSLPKGAIVVHSPGGSADATHGHIVISTGNGKGVSDHEENLAYLNTSFRVFVPSAA